MSQRTDTGCTLGHPDTPEGSQQQMMSQLYSMGWGYHAIADLAGRPHEEVRQLLIRNWPALENATCPDCLCNPYKPRTLGGHGAAACINQACPAGCNESENEQ